MHPLFEMDNYLIQTKFLKIFGGTYWFKDFNGQTIAYSKQKAFKLKEDIILYSDESCTHALLQIKARQMLDLAATYDVIDLTPRTYRLSKAKILKINLLKIVEFLILKATNTAN
ncbi:MAG: hypothetical protein CM15mP8_1060 [Methanobacteriota archaeon]|nr:MAG: hypothetical protein CM15mP8_1060 [Euryarchaeota archaeon]